MTAVVSELAEEANASVSVVCRALQCSRSGFYARKSRATGERARETVALDVEIKAMHKEHRGLYGSPRIHRELRARGRRVGRKRVEARMRALGLQARRPKRFRRTTDSAHAFPAAPNLLNRRFSWDRPNAAWVGDISFIWTTLGWVYLAILVDLCTRRIVGWATSTHCDTELALRALNDAVARHQPPRGLLHHTDRGSTYANHDYRKRLEELGMIASMSRVGNCWDNAVAESTIGTIKIECLDDSVPFSQVEVDRTLFNYIERFYNSRRRHSTLDFMAPIAFEALFTQERRVA